MMPRLKGVSRESGTKPTARTCGRGANATTTTDNKPARDDAMGLKEFLNNF